MQILKFLFLLCKLFKLLSFPCAVLQNQRKALCLNEMQHLQQRISREGADAVVQRLLSLSRPLKVNLMSLPILPV